MNYTDEIIHYLGCPCEVMAGGLQDDAPIIDWYLRSIIEGKSEGYTPLIIIPSDTLWDAISYGGTFQREKILEEAKDINPKAFFHERLEADPDYYGDMAANFEKADQIHHFISYRNYIDGTTEELILAKIPTTKPWELAAWIPMGGWNDCPLPCEQVAIFKYWYDSYESYPAVVGSDTWEFDVHKMPKDVETALKLAKEHYIWCGDRVDQCGDGSFTLGTLAGQIINSEVWYFWWD